MARIYFGSLNLIKLKMNKKLKSEVINLHKKETILNKSVEHKIVFMLVILLVAIVVGVCIFQLTNIKLNQTFL